MYSICKFAQKSIVTLFLLSAVNVYAAASNNEFKLIADINALNFSNDPAVLTQTPSPESAANIVKYVTANLNSLVDNKFGLAKKQLMANLPKIKDLASNSNKMKLQRLAPDLDLITIQTYNAGYQSAGIFLIYDLKNIKLSVVPFEQGKRYEFENLLDFKKIGDNLIQVTTKSRAAGDCGTISNYKYADGFFKLVKQREFKCTN